MPFYPPSLSLSLSLRLPFAGARLNADVGLCTTASAPSPRFSSIPFLTAVPLTLSVRLLFSLLYSLTFLIFCLFSDATQHHILTLPLCDAIEGNLNIRLRYADLQCEKKRTAWSSSSSSSLLPLTTPLLFQCTRYSATRIQIDPVASRCPQYERKTREREKRTKARDSTSSPQPAPFPPPPPVSRHRQTCKRAQAHRLLLLLFPRRTRSSHVAYEDGNDVVYPPFRRGCHLHLSPYLPA